LLTREARAEVPMSNATPTLSTAPDSNAAPAAPAPRTSRPSRAERRAELLEAAIRAIRRGSQSLSMNDLAAEAGITKPILYRHFGDRRGLVNAITLHLVAQLTDFTEARVREVSDGADRSVIEQIVPAPTDDAESVRRFLKALVRSYFVSAESEPELFRFVMQEAGFRTLAAELHPEAPPGSYLGHTIARLLGPLMQDQGGDSTSADLLGQALAGAVESSVRWWTEASEPKRQEIAETLTEFLWSGVRGALD
jgi:AcrR family transcriptional regulator